MKNIYFKIFLALIALTLFSSCTSDWDDVGDPGFSNNGVIHSKIAIDNLDSVYVAYIDTNGLDNSQSIQVKKFNGTEWLQVGTGNISVGNANYSSLALDNNGIPYIAYIDSDNGNDAIVKKYVNNEWVVVGNTDVFGMSVKDVEIVIDGNNVPYIKSLDNLGDDYVIVKKLYNNEWVTVGGGNVTSHQTTFATLGLDNNNLAYVAYDAPSSTKIVVVKDNINEWLEVGNSQFSAGMIEYPSLAFDSENTPHIGYNDKTNNRPNIMKLVNNIWTTVGTADFDDNYATYLDISFDENDTLYVTYQKGGGNATVKKLVDNAWANVELEITNSIGSNNYQISNSNAYYTQIDINSQGIPYIVYSDANYNNKITVKNYPSKVEKEDTGWELVGDFNSNESMESGDWFPNIQVDNNGVPYVVYSNSQMDGGLSVKKYVNDEWVFVGGEIAGNYNGFKPVITFDNNNTPVIAYFGENSKLVIENFNGTDWVVVSEEFDVSIGQLTLLLGQIEIKFDSNNDFHLMYQNLDNGGVFTHSNINGQWKSYEIITATNTFLQASLAISDENEVYLSFAAESTSVIVLKADANDDWQQIGETLTADGLQFYHKLQIGSDGVPYLASSVLDNSNNLLGNIIVQKYVDDDWIPVGNGIIENTSSLFLDMELTQNNEPVISYSNYYKNNKMNVARLENNIFVPLGLSNFSIDEALYSNMTLDEEGNAYVVYMDKVKNYNVTVKKYVGSRVVTNVATNEDIYTTDISGSVSEVYNETLLERGFVLSSTETIPNISNSTKYDDNNTVYGSFEKSLSGLNPNTTYYYRAYGEYSIGGVFYGKVMSFTTTAIEPATQAKNITYHSITKNRIGLRWTKGNGKSRIVLASNSPLNGSSYLKDRFSYTAGNFGVNTLPETTGVSIVYNGDNTTCLVEGLTRNTLYYFRVFEYNGNGISCNYKNSNALNNPSSKVTSKKETEFEKEDIEVMNIYPNPVKDVLNLELNLPFENATISIINEVGQEVYNSIELSNILKINTLDYTNGVYHIIISNGNEMIYNSFVLER